MLKTSSIESAEPRKSGVKVGGNGRAGRGRSEIDGSRMDNVEVDGGEVEVDEVGKKVQNLSKSKKMIRSSDFLTSGAKLAFTELSQAFIKAPILQHFDAERHIRVETDVLGYTIGGVLNQLTSDDLS